MKLVLLYCLFLAVGAPHARADDTWHNIYHSLKRFFTGDDKHASSISQRKHPRHSHARSSSAEPQGHSPEPRTVVLPQSPAETDDRAGKAAEMNAGDPKPVDGKPANPKPAETAAPNVKAAETRVGEGNERGDTNIKPAEPAPTVDSSPVLRSVP
jgi:hypothetical protein